MTHCDILAFSTPLFLADLEEYVKNISIVSRHTYFGQHISLSGNLNFIILSMSLRIKGLCCQNSISEVILDSSEVR